MSEIRQALSKEGYEGGATSVVDRSGDSVQPTTRTVTMRPQFQELYRKFEGKIYLPKFCIRREGQEEEFDYYRHLLSAVDFSGFDLSVIQNWEFASELREAVETFRRVNLSEEALEGIEVRAISIEDDDARTRAWLTANLKIEMYSAKQLRGIVNRICDALPEVQGKLALVRFRLLEQIRGLIAQETERQTRARFHELYASGELFFGLACLDCRYVLPPSVERRYVPKLRHRNDTELQRSLFDTEPDDLNEYEKSVALYLDTHPNVLWWYRNLVGKDQFAITGSKNSPMYPDFVVQEADSTGKPEPKVLVLETKGKQLKGNEDTEYKREIAVLFEKCGKQVPWQDLGEGFEAHHFRFQILDQGEGAERDWRTELDRLFRKSLPV